MSADISDGSYYIGHWGHSAKDHENRGLSDVSPNGDSGGDGSRLS